jgi:hypothetical protein
MNDSREPPRHCHNCGSDLSLGTLACEKCHALVYSEELARLSHRPKSREEAGNVQQAREEWSKALPLLPSNATQAEWVRSHLAKLDLQLRSSPPQLSKPKWARRFGPLAPVLLLLAKGKFLLTVIFKLEFLLSFFGFIALYWSLFGARFGIGFVVLILVHEMGHSSGGWSAVPAFHKGSTSAAWA